MTLGAQMVAMMNMGAAQGGEDPFADFGEEKAKEKAAGYGEGVEFVSVDKEEKDGKVSFTAVYKFADITKFKYEPGNMMDDGEDGAEAGPDQKLTFELKDGVLTMISPEFDKDDFAMGDEDMSEEEMQMAAPMMAGMKMTAKVVFEDGIESSDATYQEGNTITVMSIDFDKLMKNEGGLKAMDKLQVENRADLAKAVKSIDGIEMESKEKVTVKMK